MKKFMHYSYHSLGQTDENLEKYSSLTEMFEQTCIKYGSQPAFTSMGNSLSFTELETLSRRFSAFLQNNTPLKQGDRVVIQLPNIMQFPVVFFGCVRAGLVVVTANLTSTSREMEHQLNDSGAKALIFLANNAQTAQEFLPKTSVETVIVTELGDMLSGLRRLLVNINEKYLKKEVPAFQIKNCYKFLKVLAVGGRNLYRKPVILPGDLAALQYTAGTTGVARGVMLTHRNILANVAQIKMRLSTDIKEGEENVINPLPFYHIYPLMMSCGVFLEMGCHSVLIADVNNLDSFVDELSRWRFTVILGIDSLLAKLCSHEVFRQLDFSALRLTTAGGSALMLSTAKRWRKLTGVGVTEGYGLTETSAAVTINPATGIQMGTVGIPLLYTELKLINEEGAMLSYGKVGELCVRGPQIMKGYWQRPEETRKVLSEDNWFKTGDIAMLQKDGYLRIIDRKDDMIQVAGFTVYPKEIEEILCGHPQIQECAAIGLSDNKAGQDIKVFVVSTNKELTEESLREYCRERLTAYKVPKYIEFLPSLPKSNIGKLLRRELLSESVKGANFAA